ncbi:MAG: GNAT family N-acetyltransferase [Proteobacteria bacterium]|nr:GNAT family N-acetyltransferase [Pseudomonadota bacterium]
MTVRILANNEREALLELLDGWDVGDGWRGRDFFDRLVGEDDGENVWIAEADGRLAACLQIFPRRLRVYGQGVPTGGIGSVYTDPAKRRSGLATALLEAAVENMKKRGFELSLLFSPRTRFYEERGWQAWNGQRAILRRKPSWNGTTVPEGLEVVPFEPSLLPAIRDLYEAYSGQRPGTAVRDERDWATSLRLAGNPDEEFRVALEAGQPVAYVRAIRLNEALTIAELGRLETAAEALAVLLDGLLGERDPDPLTGGRQSSAEFRTAALVPSFDDLPLIVALEHRDLTSAPVDDATVMLRCLNVPAVAGRLDVSLFPDESESGFLQRILPPDHFVFWPADRF